MNEKLRNHINILFAAAPKNRKAEELKEELLTNLNDKYDDLLKSGYDSTSAFHIALSGIGDIDELFRECRESAEYSGTAQNGQATVGQDEKSGVSNDSAIPAPKTTSSGCLSTPLLIAIAIGLPVYAVINYSHIHVATPIGTAVTLHIVSAGLIVGLIIYLAIKNSRRDQEKPHACQKPNDMTTSFSQTQAMDNAAVISGEITSKRIIAGILAIILGVFGVHKFFLGYTTAGLIMLLATLLFVFVPVVAIIAFIEGILYLAKNDQDFYRDYVQRKRPWF